MAGPQLDPMVVAAVMFSVDREVGRRGESIVRPATTDLATLYEYWRAATAICGEDLALTVAGDLPTGALGLASFSLMSQPTLADALDNLGAIFLGRIVPGMALRVLPIPFDAVDVRLHSDGDAEMMPLLEEIVLAVIHRHLALLTTPATVQAVTLRRPAPSSSQPWRSFFGVTPRFAQRYTTLRLQATDLRTSLRTANPELQDLARAAAAQPPDTRLATRVRTYVRHHLRDELDAADVATALELTPRTLQRRLQEEQTSLRELVTTVRVEIAREMLEHGDATIAEVADSVGFAQPASFTRAFVAGTGETPQAYRKRVRGD